MAYPSNQPDGEVQFLFDECVTPRLAEAAAAFGYFGQHVVAMGLASVSDDVICTLAVESGRILVTNNGRDFRKLYRRYRHHPGLVILMPSVRWREQVSLFEALLRFIETDEALIDRVVEIRRDGKIVLQPWPVIAPVTSED